MVGALLSGSARVSHHNGFKAAWQECDAGTVLKHLDNDAPALQVGAGGLQYWMAAPARSCW